MVHFDPDELPTSVARIARALHWMFLLAAGVLFVNITHTIVLVVSSRLLSWEKREPVEACRPVSFYIPSMNIDTCASSPLSLTSVQRCRCLEVFFFAHA